MLDDHLARAAPGTMNPVSIEVQSLLVRSPVSTSAKSSLYWCGEQRPVSSLYGEHRPASG
eukprot:3203763-Pyramimonas_sp.AAC.2